MRTAAASSCTVPKNRAYRAFLRFGFYDVLLGLLMRAGSGWLIEIGSLVSTRSAYCVGEFELLQARFCADKIFISLILAKSFSFAVTFAVVADVAVHDELLFYTDVHTVVIDRSRLLAGANENGYIKDSG
ncbi:hypothetical protein R1flu_019069 [Riccia fluitans]|uniref:Uncharacterized protein n=1 Tax=Riccia fluitans TaxID=41844 RepID=A0ABD1ZHL9_9MARC